MTQEPFIQDPVPSITPSEQAQNGIPPYLAMMQLLCGKFVSYSLYGIADIGVADHMSSVPASVEELAQKTGSHAPSLYRVMRMLAGFGVFQEFPGKSFTLTELGAILRTDSPASLRHLAMAWGLEFATRGYEHIAHSIRTGQDGITRAYGKHVFEVFAEKPEQAEIFHHAMMNISAVASEAIAEAYDFSSVHRLADVGGGHGMLLAGVLRRNPHLRGVLFDLPEVVETAHGAHLSDLKDRVQIQSGNFFETAPAQCDAYILKHILHDWDDERATLILKTVAGQMEGGSRVLICEAVIGDEPGPSPAKLIDIEMLALTPGGRERTLDEYQVLFAAAGLRLERTVTTGTPFVVMEARRA